MRELTTSEVAEALAMSPASIQRYARLGQIPFDTTPGGHRRFDLDEVRAAMPVDGSRARRAPTRRVVVLTALQVEFDAMCEELVGPVDRTLPSGTIFTEGDLEGDAIRWEVAVAEIAEGNLGAAAEASAAIDYYKPDLVMFVGVAGGLKADVPQGSVVVATKIYQYQAGKDADEVLTRPNAFPTDHALVQLAMSVRRSPWDWEGQQPIVVVKPIAAGDLVLANSKSATAALIRRNFNDANAVDMESAGLYQAAHRARGVPALAVRGISDMLDDKSEENDADWQPIAARNAARFAVALLQRATETQLQRSSNEEDDGSEFLTLLERLPPNVAETVQSIPGSARSIEWVRALASADLQPAAALAQVRRSIKAGPFVDAGWTRSLAEYAHAHGMLAESLELYEELAKSAEDVSSAYAHAGFVALAMDDPATAALHLRRAEEISRTDADRAFATMLRLLVEGDNIRALSAAEGIDAANSLGQIVRCRLMVAVGRVAEARDLVTALVRDHPRTTAGMMLEAAERLVQATHVLRPEEGEQRHLQHAYELAVAARDQRRAWRGDSAAAAAMAARVAGLLDNYQAVLSLALESPRGQATSAEARHSELRQLGCYAALQLSNYGVARELAAGIDDPVETELIRALLVEAEGGGVEQFTPCLERVLQDENATPDQLARALLQQARHGIENADGLERLDQMDETLAQFVRARFDLIRGDSSSARRRLGDAPSPIALEMLNEIAVREGRVDDAVLRLRERFEATSNAAYLADAAALLLTAERFEEARDLALQALAVSDSIEITRHRLELLAVQIFGRLHDWAQVQRFAKRVLQTDPSNADVAWALVFALHNQRRLPEGLETLTEFELTPRNENEATCALVLWRQSGDPARAIDASLSIARRFPDSEEVVGTALMSSMDLSARMPSETKPDAGVAAALSELTDVFFTSWPDSDMVTRISADTPDELIERMQTVVRDGSPPQELVDLARSAQLGQVPLGLVAALAGRPVTELLISKAAGAPLVSSPDPSAREAEYKAALDAIDGGVVCDTHSLVVLASLGEAHRSRLTTEFTRLRVPRQVIDDVLDGNDRLQRRSTGTLTWDESEGRMRLTEITNEQADELARAANAVAAFARGLLIESVSLDAAFKAPRLGAVIAPIELARQLGLPLWTDDPGLRSTSRGEGVSCFGTQSLVDALTGTEKLSQLQGEAIMRELLALGFDVDVDDRLLWDYLSAARFAFPAANVLARRTVWAVPSRGLELLKAAIGAVDPENSDHFRCLVAAAALGATAAATDETRMNVLVAVGLSSLFQSASQVVAFPEVVDALRYAARSLTLPDPLTGLARGLLVACREGVADAQLANRLVLHMVGGAQDDDRRLITELLLSASP